MREHRQEWHLYTVEQAEKHLRDALELVDRVDPPAELRVEALHQAVEMLRAKQVNIVAQAPTALGILQGVPAL